MRLIYFFILILLLKFIVNLSKYLKAKWYLSRYMDWLTNRDTKLLESKAQVVRILKDAGVTDSYIGIAEPLGFMQIRTANVSVFANFPHARGDFASIIHGMFREAIGTYRSRMLETFNPLYWIEAVINLPKQIFTYLGLPPESVITKIAQLIWWVFGAIFGFIYALYRPEFETIVRNWLGKLVK